jgi:hypothetical protein
MRASFHLNLEVSNDATAGRVVALTASFGIMESRLVEGWAGHGARVAEGQRNPLPLPWSVLGVGGAKTRRWPARHPGQC